MLYYSDGLVWISIFSRLGLQVIETNEFNIITGDLTFTEGGESTVLLIMVYS